MASSFVVYVPDYKVARAFSILYGISSGAIIFSAIQARKKALKQRRLNGGLQGDGSACGSGLRLLKLACVLLVLLSLIQTAGFACRAWYARNLFTGNESTVIRTFVALSTLLVIGPVYQLTTMLILLYKYLEYLGVTMVFVLPRARFIRILIGSNVAGMALQIAGSANVGLSSESTIKSALNLLRAGLTIQLAVIVVMFGCMFIHSKMVAHKDPKKTYVLVMFCIFVLLATRFALRAAEFYQGFLGTIATHEWLYYVFDATPILVNIWIFCAPFTLATAMEMAVERAGQV